MLTSHRRQHRRVTAPLAETSLRQSDELWMSLLRRFGQARLRGVITDPQPRTEARRREYERSDALATMPLPPAEPVQALARALSDAMGQGETTPVRRAGAALLDSLSTFYRVPVPPLRVLGV